MCVPCLQLCLLPPCCCCCCCACQVLIEEGINVQMMSQGASKVRVGAWGFAVLQQRRPLSVHRLVTLSGSNSSNATTKSSWPCPLRVGARGCCPAASTTLVSAYIGWSGGSSSRCSATGTQSFFPSRVCRSSSTPGGRHTCPMPRTAAAAAGTQDCRLMRPAAPSLPCCASWLLPVPHPPPLLC